MSETTISKGEVRGTASGVLFMAFFGTLWANIGIGGLQELEAIWLLSLAVLIGLALFVCGITLFRASRGLSNHLNQAEARHSKRVGMWFNIILAAEFVLIAAAGAICNATGHFEWFFPVMALIVGIHFFPLASLFQVRVHYVAGALLCLVAVVTVLFVPLKVTVGQHEINAWWTSVGFGSAFILWGTGTAIWLMGRGLLRSARIEKE